MKQSSPGDNQDEDKSLEPIFDIEESYLVTKASPPASSSVAWASDQDLGRLALNNPQIIKQLIRQNKVHFIYLRL